MGHGIFSGNNSLNVTVRLAGCHIDVIFKLHTTPTMSEAVSHTNIQSMTQVIYYLVAMIQALQTTGQQRHTHLAGDWIQWQKVKIWQVEEDRIHFWHPARPIWCLSLST